MTGIAVSFILLKIHPLNIDGKVKAFIKLCWAFEIDAVTPICFDVVLIPRSIVVSASAGYNCTDADLSQINAYFCDYEGTEHPIQVILLALI